MLSLFNSSLNLQLVAPVHSLDNFVAVEAVLTEHESTLHPPTRQRCLRVRNYEQEISWPTDVVGTLCAVNPEKTETGRNDVFLHNR